MLSRWERRTKAGEAGMPVGIYRWKLIPLWLSTVKFNCAGIFLQVHIFYDGYTTTPYGYWYSLPHFNQLFASWQWSFIILSTSFFSMVNVWMIFWQKVNIFDSRGKYEWAGRPGVGDCSLRVLQVTNPQFGNLADGNQVIFIWDAVVEGSWDQCSQYRHHITEVTQRQLAMDYDALFKKM